MKLPQEFLNRMKMMLDEIEYEQLLKSYDEPRYYGLRVNTLKISVDTFSRLVPFKAEPVPWTKDGFYYPEGINPGRHPYYHAGLYYIQEPSAMLPGAVLDAQPGEKILDLCAAPGGKTVQISAGMKGRGIIIANDISSERVKALIKNIELCGIRNAVVTNETPEKLALKLTGYFDKILVDAPCSGEGMFRKDPEAARSWESFKCDRCAGMQQDILQHVDRMLKPGGRLVYSTCTFSPDEDEKMITRFLNEHKDYVLVDIPKTGGIEDGRPEWSDGNAELKKTARLWPHKLKGEGHFVAMLEKCCSMQNGTNVLEAALPLQKDIGSRKHTGRRMKAYGNIKEASREKADAGLMEAYNDFAEKNLNIIPEGYLIVKGDNLYCLPEPLPDLDGVKVAKFGWYLGGVSGEKFLPSHSMSLSLDKKDFKRTIDFEANSNEIKSYLRGETLMLDGQKGFTAICVDGYPVGWAKQMGGMLKNMYPKGWRRQS